MPEKIEIKKVMIVGMNRPRLTKIMSIFEERQSSDAEDLSEKAALHVDAVPCLAAMGSYEDEDGNPIRYLSNFVSLDGSPLTQFLDDEAFRSQLESVLMVGYEWHPGDENQIENYFEINNLQVTIEMVQPNSGFQNLQQEMDTFKTLDEADKKRCATEGTMGPSKMAKFAFEFIKKMQREKIDAIEKEKARLEAESQPPSTAPEPERVRPKVEPADPNRPRYACRMCRTILLGENHLAQDHVQNLHSFRRTTNKQTCQSLFCSEETLAWLSPSGREIEGKLTCPKCSHKIGHWNWAGAQCSCGTWVTPAIQIPMSKVDTIPPSLVAGNPPSGVVLPSVVLPMNT